MRTNVRIIDDNLSKYEFSVMNPGEGTVREFVSIKMGDLSITMSPEQFDYLLRSIKEFLG